MHWEPKGALVDLFMFVCVCFLRGAFKRSAKEFTCRKTKSSSWRRALQVCTNIHHHLCNLICHQSLCIFSCANVSKDYGFHNMVSKNYSEIISTSIAIVIWTVEQKCVRSHWNSVMYVKTLHTFFSKRIKFSVSEKHPTSVVTCSMLMILTWI